MVNITPIVEAVIGLATAVITVFLSAYLRNRMSETDRAKLADMVKTAVEAAEQIYSASGMGEQKKAFVLEWLEARGVTVNVDELDAMIEAAVYQLGNTIHGD